MRVCIIRNAESRTNAALFRIISAMVDSGKSCLLLTRNRYSKGTKKRVVKKAHKYKNHKLANYEINIKSTSGNGLRNILELIYYQWVVFVWLIKNHRKYDIIHAFDLDSGLPVAIASKILRREYVYHIADFYIDSRIGIPKLLKNIIKRLEYIIINNANTTIICTEERKQQIKGSKPRKLVVVHNTPSIRMLNKDECNNKAPLSNLEERKITFTYVGGLNERRFIKSIINIFKRRPEFILQLAGMGALSTYAEQASKDFKNIEYYGMINYEKALELYAKCDVMFAIYDPEVPNHRYSAPNKVYEAMQNGKPIIVAKNTGVDAIVRQEDMGFIIDYDMVDFERVLKTISKNKQILKKYGESA